MTNRDKLLSMSLYDLIMSLGNGGFVVINDTAKYCKLSTLTNIISSEHCKEMGCDCSKCIERYLNEEVKQDGDT